jgi:hypothetical protein
MLNLKLSRFSRWAYITSALLLALALMFSLAAKPVLAQDGGEIEDPPPAEQSEEPVDDPIEEPFEDPLEEPLEEPAEELLEELTEEPVLESQEMLSAAAPVGESNKTPTELGLPEPGPSGGYNSACEQPENSSICEKEDLSDGDPKKGGGTFTPTTITTAKVVVIKAGNEEYFYEKDGGDTCSMGVGTDPYCVEFHDDGSITVTVNPCYNTVGAQEQCQAAHGISNVQFWLPDDPGDDDDAGDDDDTGDDDDDAGDDDDDDTPGIPVTAAGGPLPQPVVSDPQTALIPVTGADKTGAASPLNVLQDLSLNLGVALLGFGMVLTGLSRRKKA